MNTDDYAIIYITGEIRGNFLACIFGWADHVYPFVQIYICSHSPFLSLTPFIRFERNQSNKNGNNIAKPKSVIFTDLSRNHGHALKQERFEKRKVTSRVSIFWSDNVITVHTL